MCEAAWRLHGQLPINDCLTHHELAHVAYLKLIIDAAWLKKQVGGQHIQAAFHDIQVQVLSHLHVHSEVQVEWKALNLQSEELPSYPFPIQIYSVFPFRFYVRLKSPPPC